MFNNNKNLFIINEKFSNNEVVEELKSHYKIEIQTQQNIDN